MAIPKEYLDKEYDFGFTTEDDITPVITQQEETIEAYKKKLQDVEKLILPLLVNLMKNPEKDTIKWPNRGSVIEKQIEKIIAITRS